jgi:carbonic anhydrase
MSEVSIDSHEQALLRLKQGNEQYINSKNNASDISQNMREKTADEGQKPYAVVLTCSDSRVPPEHIFSAGLGELFVVRTAGLTLSHFDLGSIEYGIKYLGAKLIVVLGHTLCGAVAASLSGKHPEGHVADIVADIRPAIVEAKDTTEAENLNIERTYKKVMESNIVRDLTASGSINVVKAKYDLHTGKADFIS